MVSQIGRHDYVITYTDNATNIAYCLSCLIEQKLRIGIEHIHGTCPCYCNLGYASTCEKKVLFDNTKHTVFATRDYCISYDKTKCGKCVINKRYGYDTKMNKE